jgi:hypothetical protein
VAPLPPAQQLTGGSTGVEPVSCTSVPPRSSTNSKKTTGVAAGKSSCVSVLKSE